MGSLKEHERAHQRAVNAHAINNEKERTIVLEALMDYYEKTKSEDVLNLYKKMLPDGHPFK